MAVDRSIRLTVDDAVTDKKWQDLIARVVAACQNAGTTTTTTGTYAAGSGATDNVAVAIA